MVGINWNFYNNDNLNTFLNLDFNEFIYIYFYICYYLIIVCLLLFNSLWLYLYGMEEFIFYMKFFKKNNIIL